MYALVAEEGVVGNGADGGDILFQIGGAPRGEEGLGGAMERPCLALVARQAKRRRAELLVCRPSEIVCPLVAVHVDVVLTFLQELDGLLRAIPLNEPHHEYVVLQQIDVVLSGDILRRLERCVRDGQDQRLRGWSDVFAEGDDQPADFRREVVVETPEAPGLEGKRPRLAG